MKTPLQYARLDVPDLPEVVRLESAAFPTPWTEDQYRVLMERGICSLFGARADAGLAGYIAVGLVPGSGEMEVYNIAVDPARRRQGIGRRLLALSLEAAALAGVERVFLEVRESNHAAIALYRSFRFVEVGRRAGYYQDNGESALVLARDSE